MAPPGTTVVMEDVQIIFRNFTGKEGKYNKEGDRNFAVVLDEDLARAMEQDGWNVKWPKPREDDEEEDVRLPYLQVALNFNKGRPPKCVLVTGRGRTHLDQDNIDMLDWADIKNVDLMINPYTWEVNGKTGIKAYLHSIYVTIEEDPLERKYAEMDQQ